MAVLLAVFVRLLSLAVPRSNRAHWREEWLAELEQIARRRGAWFAVRVAAGSIPDALAVRRVGALRAGDRASGFLNIGLSWMDVKLGLRMLRKYPGLTLVGGVGMTVAVAVGASSFAFIYASMHPTLPLPDGDRIVGLENWDTEINNQEYRSLHDFVAWRTELTSVQDLSAFRTLTRNVVVPGGRAVQIIGAEMSASGFRVVGVPPLFGRPLLDEDERDGGPAVVVIGHDLWRTQFASDPSVVGRSVRIGSTLHSVIGVMPPDFAFPISQQFWTPLRLDPADYERREGPAINMFGRLAPGVALEQAQAELAAVGSRASATFPKSHARLRPKVVPYTQMWFDDEPKSQLAFMQLLISMLVVVVGVNVAILIYARTATRQAEILVRTALGASRRRIVGQLFVEALVLSSLSAAAGLGLAHLALQEADAAAKQLGARFGGLPFWMTFTLSSGTVLYVAGLAVVAAVIAGVIPALQATGRRMESRLKQLGGSTGLQLGRTWTALIVVQVAFAVAALPGAVYMASQSIRILGATPGFAAGQFLTARVGMDREVIPSAAAAAYAREFASRYQERLLELAARVRMEPGVAGVTMATAAPGQEPIIRVEVEGVAAPADSAPGHRVRSGRVDAEFFELFDVPHLAGRVDPRVEDDVVVNRAFVQEILGGANPIGRRIRYVAGYRSGGIVRMPNAVDADRWYDIVGVVGDLPERPLLPDHPGAALYHPLARAHLSNAALAIRMRGGDPSVFAARLREVTVGLDPSLQLRQVLPLTDLYRQEQMGLHWGALAFAVVTLSVLFLSAAGIYALMSFTVTRRRKEIGIRVALGADRARILRSIFSRAFAQLALGVVVGAAVAALLDSAVDGDLMGGHWVFILPPVAAFMMSVGLLAAVGPARRGLRVHPTDALREE